MSVTTIAVNSAVMSVPWNINNLVPDIADNGALGTDPLNGAVYTAESVHLKLLKYPFR